MSPMVQPLWCDPAKLPKNDHLKIYQTCQRGVPTRCINTRALKAMAKYLGRVVRKVDTRDGYVSWSELVAREWHRFCMPLNHIYATRIDDYDKDNTHFKLPKKTPFGPVEYKGPCEERFDPLHVIRERKVRHNQRVLDGLAVPRLKFRKPQAPFVAQMNFKLTNAK